MASGASLLWKDDLCVSFHPLESCINLHAHALLFTSSRTSSASMPSYTFTKRGTRFLIFAIFLCFVFPTLFYHRETVKNYFIIHDRLPPLYEEYREQEQRLAHYQDYEARKDVKYLWSA